MVVGTHWNCLAKAIPMSTHNHTFCGEIRKIHNWILLLSKAMDRTRMLFSVGKGKNYNGHIHQNSLIKQISIGKTFILFVLFSLHWSEPAWRGFEPQYKHWRLLLLPFRNP